MRELFGDKQVPTLTPIERQGAGEQVIEERVEGCAKRFESYFETAEYLGNQFLARLFDVFTNVHGNPLGSTSIGLQWPNGAQARTARHTTFALGRDRCDTCQEDKLEQIPLNKNSFTGSFVRSFANEPTSSATIAIRRSIVCAQNEATLHGNFSADLWTPTSVAIRFRALRLRVSARVVEFFVGGRTKELLAQRRGGAERR